MSAAQRLALGIAGVVAVGGVVVGSIAMPTQQSAPVNAVEVTGTSTTLCPAVPGDGDSIAVVGSHAVGTGGAQGLGSVSLGPVGAEPSPRELGVTSVETYRDPLAVALGSPVLAGATVVHAQPEAPGGGLAALSCAAPSTQRWFSGVQESQDGHATLTLTNPDDSRAVVDLDLYGSQGRIVAPGSRGIEVPGGGTVRVPLEPLLAGQPGVGESAGVTVGVHASVGRVDSSVWQQGSVGQPDLNRFIVATHEPATSQVIPVAAGGEGERTLLLATPHDRRAEVAVEFVTETGRIVPIGTENISMAAQSTLAVDLAAGLQGEAGSLVVTGSQPVVASVRTGSAEDLARSDLGDAPAAAQLTEPSVVVLPREGQAYAHLVNEGEESALVEFSFIDPSGQELERREVEVGPGAAVVSEVPPGTALVTFGAAPRVYAGVQLTREVGPRAGLAVLTPQPAMGAQEQPVPPRDPQLG
ncbi:DUF5719 family protein [Parenemella sanctibonifatiensis]|uniref:Secreted protein n=1 Tax=Parenemella sanctibonifatiensis TaxID=2016505 RepID=A0A255E8N0_9ACTN|nr:DUF5719 family protein [Parenemella sanctibonifatiensis]OYN87866.1 hypothetical protein CGZ92_06295 [Parenemella sanctibonifatiensis]